jgi:hypothetical protein
MFKKIKEFTIVLASAFLMAVPVMVPATAHAANTVKGGLCNGILAANGESNTADTPNTGDECTKEDENQPNVNSVIHTVINFFSLIVGVISVIMLIYGGFKYITSGGDSGKVTGAKNTIVYALIGLIIVALAQVIVRFVLTKATSTV